MPMKTTDKQISAQEAACRHVIQIKLSKYKTMTSLNVRIVKEEGSRVRPLFGLRTLDIRRGDYLSYTNMS